MKSALEAIRARALERLQNAEDLTALEEARVQPVSYTHLDVYKRQALYSVRPSPVMIRYL